MIVLNVSILLGISLLLLYVILFYEYYRRKEKVLLYFSLAFLSLSVGCLVNGITHLASLSVFVSFFWIGTIEMLSPGIITKYSEDLKYLSLVPIVAYLYFSVYSVLVVLVIDAVIMVLSAFLLYMERDKPKFVPFLLLLFSILTFGLMTYPDLIFKVQVVIAVVLGYIITVETLKVAIPTVVKERISLKPGVLFMKEVPDEILKTALVFSRNPGDENNERWFWITKVQKGPRTIEPTNLVKILNLSVKYLEQGGIVVIDGFEYLVLENGFESILKFLAHLRDYALLYSSSAIVVSDLTNFPERERNLILRVIGEEI
ncbi:DUF835 domain-containing protein [Pyrococcus kukulkanii]|uniref:DUF835 domain-containing protein n=1 Tax=Pyrococcus kukulkanii TaxID=1609559 RepID=UPI00356B357B